MKRHALQNKRVEVLQMAFQAIRDVRDKGPRPQESNLWTSDR